MTAEFRREFQHQYMVFSSEALSSAKSYEYGMLKYNHIPGLLPLTIQEMNGKTFFYYEVTGLVSLADAAETTGADAALFSALFSGLANLLDSLEEYLLGIHTLAAEPEQVFFDASRKTLYLACCPALQEDFYGSLKNTAAFLLGKLDHKDREAVVCGYQFYQGCVEKRITSDFLKELLYRPEKEEKGEEPHRLTRQEGRKESPAEEPEPGPQQNKPREKMMPSEERLSLLFEEDEDVPAKKKEKKKEKRKRERKPLFSFRKRKERKGKGEGGQALPDRKDPVSIYGEEDSDPFRTVLLSDRPGKKTKVRAWLIPEELFKEDSHALSEDEYLIGREGGSAGICLDSPGVSRIHARLVWEEDAYYLTDLQSANGTFAGGERLAGGVARRLSEGEEIAFGDARFRYCTEK